MLGFDALISGSVALSENIHHNVNISYQLVCLVSMHLYLVLQFCMRDIFTSCKIQLYNLANKVCACVFVVCMFVGVFVCDFVFE